MSGKELLNRRVLMRGIELGRAVDVILGQDGERPIGVDVLCRDGAHRFLPLSAATVGRDDIEVETPLTILESDQLDFYRSRGRALRSSP